VLYLQKGFQFIDYIIGVINWFNIVLSRQVTQIISITFIVLINSKVQFFIVFNIARVELVNVLVLNTSQYLNNRLRYRTGIKQHATSVEILSTKA